MGHWALGERGSRRLVEMRGWHGEPGVKGDENILGVEPGSTVEGSVRAGGGEAGAAAEELGEPSVAWKTARWVEFAALFVIGPAVMALYLPTRLLFPSIWVLAAISLALLLPDKSFEKRRLWNAGGVRRVWPEVLGRFVVCAVLLAGVLGLFEPERLLQLPKRNPGLWAIIMFAYPVFSVYPQEIAFRALYFHRYERLFKRETVLIAVGAVVFGYAHIVMHNWWSVAFSMVGGVFFGLTYRRSKSLLAACIEHALYGCFLFTIGWGWYFFAGAAAIRAGGR